VYDKFRAESEKLLRWKLNQAKESERREAFNEPSLCAAAAAAAAVLKEIV
jgi:hypothetical protein